MSSSLPGPAELVAFDALDSVATWVGLAESARAALWSALGSAPEDHFRDVGNSASAVFDEAVKALAIEAEGRRKNKEAALYNLRQMAG